MYADHPGSACKVRTSPMITKPRRARVIITLSRRQSAKKPTLRRELLRTALNKINLDDAAEFQNVSRGKPFVCHEQPASSSSMHQQIMND